MNIKQLKLLDLKLKYLRYLLFSYEKLKIILKKKFFVSFTSDIFVYRTENLHFMDIL